MVSSITHDQYLDAISCPRIDPVAQGRKILTAFESDIDVSQDDEDLAAASSDGLDDDWFVGDPDFAADELRNDASRPQDQPRPRKRDDGREVFLQHGIEYGTMPKGKPTDRESEVTIERLCRLVCLEPHEKHEDFLTWLRDQVGGKVEYGFLNPDHNSHDFFSWRLSENEAGRGLPPDFDVPGKPPVNVAQKRSTGSRKKSTRGRRK